MWLSEHFTVEEFGCRDGTPYPVRWIDARLRPLAGLLEKIRAEFAAPIEIVSGYRTPAYNRKIGGARRSQHVNGRAADIRAPHVRTRDLHAIVLALYKTGEMPGLGGLGSYPEFTHIDMRRTTWLKRWQGSRLAT